MVRGKQTVRKSSSGIRKPLPVAANEAPVSLSVAANETPTLLPVAEKKFPRIVLVPQLKTVIRKTKTTRGAPRVDPTSSMMPPPPTPPRAPRVDPSSSKVNDQVPKIKVDGEGVFDIINLMDDGESAKRVKKEESLMSELASHDDWTMLRTSPLENLISEAFQHTISAPRFASRLMEPGEEHLKEKFNSCLRTAIFLLQAASSRANLKKQGQN